MMKKIVAWIVCIALCTVCGISGVWAADGAVSTVGWYGDYANTQSPKLVVTVDSAVNYIQRVTAVMYPADVQTPTIEDYVRITEAEVKGKESAKIEIPIGNDLTYRDEEQSRHYTLRLKGSGYAGNNVNTTLDVYVMIPGEIPTSLENIGKAKTVNEIKAALYPMLNALQIEKSEMTDARILCFIDSKTEDFQNQLQTLDDLKSALTIAEVIEYLKKDTASAAGLKTLAESHAEVLGIDLTDVDYIRYADSIYASVLRVKNSYRKNATDQVGIRIRKSLKNAMDQYQAVAVINAESSLSENAEDTVKKYASTLGISQDMLSKFQNLSKDDRKKGMRVLLENDTDYADPSEIVTAFSSMVGTLSNPKNENNSSVNGFVGGSSGGGGGGGLGGGREVYGITEEPKEDEKPTSGDLTEFSDLSSSHWAYAYVHALKQLHIVSGYENGAFCPENSVTREEFIKMVISAVGLYDQNAVCDFLDVAAEDWCYPYIASAVQAEVVRGLSEDTFGIGSFITREDVAVIAARVLDRFDAQGQPTENAFTDKEKISDYAKESVDLLCGMEILQGFEDGSFRPQACLTRAEAAKIIYMMMNALS